MQFSPQPSQLPHIRHTQPCNAVLKQFGLHKIIAQPTEQLLKAEPCASKRGLKSFVLFLLLSYPIYSSLSV